MMSLAGILLGRMKKIETTMYVLDLWPENLYTVLNVRNKFLRAFLSRVSIWYYRKSDKLIANSQKLMELLKERTNKSDDKIVYIPQFCEKAYELSLNDEELRSQFANTFNMVFTGNISPAQSFETILQAAKQLNMDGYTDIRWIIVGDGMSKKWLESEVQSEGLSDCFVFVGRMPMEEIPKYTDIADGLIACLVKSDMLDATIPAKVFSYYAAGRPMVLSMDGEIQQIIDESKAGYAVDAEDSAGLAEAVVKLYDATENERKRMGENAKEYYFKHFERNLNMKKLIGFMFDEQ